MTPLPLAPLAGAMPAGPHPVAFVLFTLAVTICPSAKTMSAAEAQWARGPSGDLQGLTTGRPRSVLATAGGGEEDRESGRRTILPLPPGDLEHLPKCPPLSRDVLALRARDNTVLVAATSRLVAASFAPSFIANALAAGMTYSFMAALDHETSAYLVSLGHGAHCFSTERPKGLAPGGRPTKGEARRG